MKVILTSVNQVSIFNILGDRIELSNGKYIEIKTFPDSKSKSKNNFIKKMLCQYWPWQ